MDEDKKRFIEIAARLEHIEKMFKILNPRNSFDRKEIKLLLIEIDDYLAEIATMKKKKRHLQLVR